MMIGIDMMGGDYAPLEAVKGVGLYLAGHNIPATLLLIGDNDIIEKLLAENHIPKENIRIVHAEQVIDMHEHPTRALKEKQQSSIAIGFSCCQPAKWMPSSVPAIPVPCWWVHCSAWKCWMA